MTSQSAQIDETIVGLKRAIAREKIGQDAYDEPITQPSNRGNKTKWDSKYVHEGSLGIMNGENFYRKKVDHAGYVRHILHHNPSRYDSDGDELDDDDSDVTADADAAQENPYSGITLETLLAPLKHPSELPDHPSLAGPYKSKAILHMVNLVDKRLRQERYALWQAKKVHRQLSGDAPWIPCGAVEKPQDRAIFEPAFLLPKELQALEPDALPPSATSNYHSNSSGDLIHERKEASFDTSRHIASEPRANGHIGNNLEAGGDTEMKDAPGGTNESDTRTSSFNTQHREQTENGVLPQKPSIAQSVESSAQLASEQKSNQELEVEKLDGPGKIDANGTKNSVHMEMEVDGEPVNTDNPQDDQGSPEPPRRMTTRAQANQTTYPQGSSRHASPEGTAAALEGENMTPHPVYQFPSIKIDRNCGLPTMEADEVRHLLWAYIQKQGETVRLFSDILEMLRKSYRLKEEVFEWCKAEGHVGEMSDGEDWYDKEKWGLPEGEDLKKGADEEEPEVDEGRATGKRGRRRQ